jgi:hypothetical protein
MTQQLDGNARDLFERSMTWLDGYWDEQAGLLQAPDTYGTERVAPGMRLHFVRETSYYALGLLSRGGQGDRERALRALTALLDNQFDMPAAPFHGTWRRAPEEPDPPEDAVVWRDYDPNWREFIGTALLVLLGEHERRLPAEIVARIDRALQLAVAGTLARQVPASYTNIALMCAWLLDACGARFGRPEWQARAEDYAEEIYALFARTGAFEEYNSPTYYGVDMAALVMWRARGVGPRLRERGAAMEAALWRDLARYYHAGLRNLAGPYDRSYGMDLRRYGGLIGLWIWLAVGRELAPFPDPARPFDHPWDFGAGPLYALLGVQAPADVLPHLRRFQGQRQVEQIIAEAPPRIATAWVGEHALLGGERGGGDRRNWKQFHPATLHWRMPDGDVGWARLRYPGPADATAERDRLSISCMGDEQAIVFEVYAPGADAALQQATRWQLPGLAVRVECGGMALEAEQQGDMMQLRYRLRAGGPATLVVSVEL